MLGDHLLGIYEKAFPAELSWQERLGAAKSLGFDFMELSIDETDARIARLNMPEQDKRAIRHAMQQSGVFFQSMCLSAHRRFPFGSADSATRQTAREIMKNAVLLAHELGIRVIQLAGYDVYYEPSDPASRSRFIDGLSYACALAQQYQVMLAVEIMDTELLSSITRYFALKSHLPSPWFRVYPDLGNLSAWGNDVLRELSIGRDEIVSVHLKDTIPVSQNGGLFKNVPFGSGCVDFPACFRQLEQQGYRGPYLIEMWHQPGQDWKASIRQATDFLRRQYLIAEETAP